jgi:CRP-like cAMP-binding protein
LQRAEQNIKLANCWGTAYKSSITGNDLGRQWLRDATALPPEPREVAVNDSDNRLLACLPTEVFDALRPHLSLAEFRQGQVLSEAGSPVSEVYFPSSGIVSLVVEMQEGQMVESAMVGRDGVVNGSSAMDGQVSLTKAIVQMGGYLNVISAPTLARIVDQHRPLRSLLIRHEQVLFAQSQQSGGCNVSHLVEARMCRWLLRTRDLARSDDLNITQEFLGQMLGVQRTSISIVAGTLQKAGLIAYRRGRVRILDAEGLKEGACECYETVKLHYEQMLSPDTKNKTDS